MPSRTEALVTIAGTRTLHRETPSFLTEAELRALTALVETIIPRTDTPGSADAGMEAWIDRRLADSGPLAGLIREGLRSIDAEAESRYGGVYASVTAAQRMEIVMTRQDEAFFVALRNLMVDAYDSSEAGSPEEAG